LNWLLRNFKLPATPSTQLDLLDLLVELLFLVGREQMASFLRVAWRERDLSAWRERDLRKTRFAYVL
jgi:hypothetical protein